MSKLIKTDIEYKQWLVEIKEQIRNSQIKAVLSVNAGMLALYFDLGKRIEITKADSKWGSGFFASLSADLREEFSDIEGFSETNLRYMKRFYNFYSQCFTIPPQLGAELETMPNPNSPQAGENLKNFIFSIPWGHQKYLIDKCKNIKKALFYIQKVRENGWSRSLLINFFETDLFEREGSAISNFSLHLPAPQSDLAQQALKDPYNFGFLSMRKGYNERELEDALTTNITKFLLELGSGFSYIGRQQRIQVGEKEFFIDLLFYHIKLRCFIVVELKTGEFKAEYVSKLGLYVSAINHQLKQASDQPTIGLLICKSKDAVVAQYTLESSSHPIGISEYQLQKLYPKKLENAIPSIDELEQELNEN
ncbi:MAG: PDDEXK nuclease domain-containing protein [Bacteroidales bacterium]